MWFADYFLSGDGAAASNGRPQTRVEMREGCVRRARRCPVGTGQPIRPIKTDAGWRGPSRRLCTQQVNSPASERVCGAAVLVSTQLSAVAATLVGSRHQAFDGFAIPLLARFHAETSTCMEGEHDAHLALQHLVLPATVGRAAANGASPTLCWCSTGGEWFSASPSSR